MSHPIDAGYASLQKLLSDYIAAPLERRGAFVAALRPQPSDLQAVFAPAPAAEAAERGYRQLWGNSPAWPVPAHPCLEMFCATSEVLASGVGDARNFPGGYRDIGCWLRAGVIWSAWSITSGGRHGNFFDGLVMIGADRWVWCPRPWKVLPRPFTSPFSWWADG